MYGIFTNNKEKKSNHDLRRLKQSPSWLPTESLCPCLFRVALCEGNRKGKGQNIQSQISPQYGHLLPLSETSLSFNRDYFSLTLVIRRRQVRQHAEANMVICSLCWRPQCLSIETTLVSPSSSGDGKSDDTRRHLTVIRILCHPEIVESDSMQRPS